MQLIRTVLGKSKAGIIVLTITVVFLTSLAVGFLAPVQIMELKLRDWLFELRGEQDVSHSDIIIVELSQEADDEIPYKYPWPTYLYGNLVDNLNEAGAKVIGIDIVFDQRDNYDLKNDSLFAESLAEHKNVILGATYSRRDRSGRSGVNRELSRIVHPNEVLRQANPNPSGLVNMVTDPDEFIRSYSLYQTVMGQERHSFILEMLRLLSIDSPYRVELAEEYMSVGPWRIPMVQRNTILINYYGGGRTFEYIGFEEVIDDQDFETVTEMEAFEINLFDDPEYGILNQGILEDKIVLVGMTMPEMQDIHPVPMKNRQGNAQMSGVEVQAHALQTILDQNYLKPAPTWITVFLIFLFSMIAVVSTRLLPGMGSLLTVMLLFAGWMSFAFYLFIAQQFILLYIGPAFALVAGYGGTAIHQYFKEKQEKQRIREMFSSYISPGVVNRLVASDEAFKLGGEEMELTVLFADIVNFTSLSEEVPATELIKFMNEFLERMTTIILEEKGTLDKYIGDAIMVIYGAPAKIEGQAVSACRSAVRMHKALRELKEEWKRRGDVPEGFLNLKMRIGINTGRMIVGNMGSSLRFNYTVLGDQVNIAADCEEACKVYGAGTIVAEGTYRKVKENGEPAQFRFLDDVKVKGRSRSVKFYELAGSEWP